jgi:hypothetical protein
VPNFGDRTLRLHYAATTATVAGQSKPRLKDPMKTAVLFVALSLLIVPAVSAQRVLVTPDTIRVTHDSTGSGQVHPHDIADEKGLFVYSANGREALRIFGSIRTLAVWDDRKNFHEFDLTQPTIPTGADDVRFPNSVWSIYTSRLGVDALIANEQSGGLLIRMEFDWKGDTERFRIRHLFVRSPHFLIGKSWSSTANISYLIQGIDARFAGGGVGVRPPQVRYYNHKNKWKYQVSLEYLSPKLLQPDTLAAEGAIVFPSLAARVDHEIGPLRWMVSGVLRWNRVQFAVDDGRSETIPGYGGAWAAAYRLGERNRIKASVSGGQGTAGFLGDFAFVDLDLVYNAGTGGFENVGTYSGFVGFEHDWSAAFTSAIGLGVAGSDTDSFFPIGSYRRGGKGLVNLFYRPKGAWDGLTVAGEVEYATRENLGTPSNNAIRASLFLIYDF